MPEVSSREDSVGALADDRPAGQVTFAELIEARAEDDRAGLRFEDRCWTWREVVAQARSRAGLARDLRRPGPWHVGLLLDNTPEHLFWLLGAALAGAGVVGINPTRRGAELAADIDFTDCGLIVTEPARRPLLDGLDLDRPPGRVLVTGTEEYARALADASPLGSGDPRPEPGTIFSLVFTSGTTSAPKAVICSQGRLGRIAVQQRERRCLGRDDVFYVVMPMFHSNAIMAGIAPAVSSGGCVVLRRRFSASAFLPDVRRHGVTFFNYVGKPLHYILAVPEREDDADNPLRIAFGNEASERDIAEFGRRFGCAVIDSYGSSEGEIRISRVPGTPPGSLGVAEEGTVVVNPETMQECPRAVFDEHGALLNADEAIGEIVNKAGAAVFEGYYRNPEATARRIRGGWSWSGDLAYRDAAGFWYFAGRDSDWLRVDGENFAAAPVERLLSRFGAFADVAVYAVPDPDVGDQVMAAVVLAEGREFDPGAFGEFLAGQPDLGTKWPPRYVRVTAELPRTATSKVVKRSLREAAWHTADPVFVRPGTALTYEPLTPGPTA
ncbi:AMP-binding protein [Nonomuraea cavernae]|uniref:Fatty-acid-CoA ligase FadD n=1 Tax=Nonomuraea cavernae TaxID=2045107 RepID=A0A917Z1V9_9ACTN|nr:AMP-binding protein [Nonomuraea cavernae]MCA2188061.1 AMP-binding protein [Nonomuraea cavernae]GGO72697.1 putative fatty-acid-CoA ligase FadD [Nonomuraea cavernae]